MRPSPRPLSALLVAAVALVGASALLGLVAPPSAHASETASAALERVRVALEGVAGPEGAILLDRGLPLAALDRMDGGPAAPAIGAAVLRQVAADLARAARPGELRGDPDRMLERGHRAAVGPVPIGLVDVRVCRLRPDAGRDGAAGVAGGRVEILRPDAFEEWRVFAAAPLAERTYRGAGTDFRLDRLLTNGPDPERIEIDFDDGRGFRAIRFGETVRAAWASSGAKSIRVRVTSPAGGSRVAASTFDVRTLGTPAPNDTLSIVATQSWQGSAGTGVAYVYLAPGHTDITNPIVMIEGFDLEDAMFSEELYELLNQQNLLEDLRADGYDAIVLDFAAATDPIPRNGFVAVELLEQVKARIAPEQDVFIVGASMGGLVGRWALTWMEQQGIETRTRAYLTFDSPHGGANIPLGVQYWLDFFSGLSADAEFLLSRLDRPAALQMLVLHHTTPPDATPEAHALRAQWLADVAALGDWPAGPRLLAIANGSAGNLDQGFGPGVQVIAYEYDSFLVDIRGNVWALPAQGTNARIFEGDIDYLIGNDTSQDVYVTSPVAWDGAPGGWRDSMAQMDAVPAPFGDIVALRPNHCFVPTISALALDTGDIWYDVDGDPDLLEITPVDAVYFQSGPNQEHVSITAESAAWLRTEVGAGSVAVPEAPILAISGLALAAPFPNPARGFATIRFVTAWPGPVRAEVVDVRGRRVALLAAALLPAGRHELRWDAAVPSGVYFVRVQAGGTTAARRLVRIRD